MFTIQVEKNEVESDYKDVLNNWTSAMEMMGKEVNYEKMEFYYSYGFFVPKVNNKDDFYEKMFEDCSKMKFEDRLVYELSKVRVNLSMKSGKFYISDRMIKGFVPKSIEDIVKEVTKVKMLLEYEYHLDDEIKDSIPEIDSDIVSFEIIKDVVSSDYSESQKFDIDSILDKISQNGMDSLSEEEKEFLNKKSKDI